MIMRIARALFWIIAVSLLLAGGEGFSGYYGERPGADYVAEYAGEKSPAYQSAERVVASVSRLNGWCNDHEKVCTVSAIAGRTGLNVIDALMQKIMSPQTYIAQGESAPDTATDERRTHLTRTDTPEDARNRPSFLDGLSDLLYDGEDELDDIG